MFADQIRRAVMVAPRVNLPEIRRALWAAWGNGQIGDDEAQSIAELIEAKATVTTEKPVPRRVGSRPRSSESMERRRRWVASGRLPPQIAARFTMAEIAVLAVVAVEVSKQGVCALTIGHIAALAGVSETSVRNAVREARTLGLVTVEERRLTAWRNAPNIVRVVSPEWSGWLRLGSRGGGYKSANPTNTDSRVGSPFARNPTVAFMPKVAKAAGRLPSGPTAPYRRPSGG